LVITAVGRDDRAGSASLEADGGTLHFQEPIGRDVDAIRILDSGGGGRSKQPHPFVAASNSSGGKHKSSGEQAVDHAARIWIGVTDGPDYLIRPMDPADGKFQTIASQKVRVANVAQTTLLAQPL